MAVASLPQTIREVEGVAVTDETHSLAQELCEGGGLSPYSAFTLAIEMTDELLVYATEWDVAALLAGNPNT